MLCVHRLSLVTLEADWLGTGWQVWLVAQDQFGNSQPSATALNLTTAADVAAPVLLEGTRPSQVSFCLFVRGPTWSVRKQGQRGVTSNTADRHVFLAFRALVREACTGSPAPGLGGWPEDVWDQWLHIGQLDIHSFTSN